MSIEAETQLDFADVLIKPLPSTIKSRKNVELVTKYSFKYSTQTLECIPIMAANMDTVGTLKVMKKMSEHKMFTCLHKFIRVDDFVQEKDFLANHLDHFAVTIGYSATEINRLEEIQKIIDFKVICIDVANGYIQSFVEYCKQVRDAFPNKIIVAGNVCTPEGVEALITQGEVDIVKCGIGGGSACTTRIKTGVGYPQFSTVLQCSATARKLGAKIISDGGITSPGDTAKAFGMGGDFVMVGGQFAGHDENPGEVIQENGIMLKEFYGMSSKRAMNKNYGGKKDYRTSEGRCIKIPYKGTIDDTIADFLGGLRSTCTYTGHSTLLEMIGNLKFIRVNNQFNKCLL